MEYSYTFPETRPAKPDLSRVNLYPEKDPESEVGLIQGRTPGSTEEWRVAKGLWRLNHQFYYQYLVGMRGLRGSQRIDFYVYSTAPNVTIIQVFGEYWHSGELGSEDAFKLAQLRQEFADRANIVVLWARELASMEDTYNRLLEEIGPG